jgi:NAD(P)-dependent dehydrogenase (short-subunit alcohol dehydrogenase family)
MYSNFEFSVHSTLAIFVLLFQRWSLRVRQRLGYAKLPPKYVEEVNMVDQIVVITGANAGIGRSTATRLASCGAIVVLGCRDIQKGIQAAQEINKQLRALPAADYPFASKGSAVFMRLDLADLSSVLDFAHRIKHEYPRVDILVNNAGLNMKGMLTTGIEQLFQVNYLGHYLLLRCLETHLSSRDSRRSSAPSTARVINLSSVMHHTGQPNFVASSRGTYSLLMQAKASYYADSKLYMHYLTMEVNRRCDFAKSYKLSVGSASSGSSLDKEAHRGQQSSNARPIVSLSVNPGAVRSEIWRDYPFKTLYNYVMKLIFLEVDEGCASSVFAATVELDRIRAYQTEHEDTQDSGGRFTWRPDVPYVLPYHVWGGFLAQEVLGVYEGCEFGGVSLPTDGEVERSGLEEAEKAAGLAAVTTGKQPSQQARRLWAYSAHLCYTTLQKAGAKESDIQFLLE